MKDKIKFVDEGKVGKLYLDNFESPSKMLDVTQEEFVCPKCGYEGGEYINVEMVGYEGKYCLQCYAKWINENMPRLELKSPQP